MTTGESHTSARALAPLALAGLLVLTGCGGDGDADAPATTAAAPAPSPDPATDAASDPASAEPSAPEPSAPEPSAPDASASAGEPPAEPTGAVPDGWQVIDPGSGTTFALPEDAAAQDVPDTGIEGLDIELYAVPDGSLLALYQSFPEDVASSVPPEELLAQASSGALGAATFAEGSEREEPFRLGDLAGTEIGGLDETTDTWLSGRLLVVEDSLLGFVATGADEAAADASLDEAWGSLTLP
ncbi:hypothetical protein [Jannaschia sp. R86511]|uniref:hypothetical protein n=1 Tax=Jannaschia sp. R86511 TaxID=3093853 RepID=UPI0036D318D7